jgi:hypothetical protein
MFRTVHLSITRSYSLYTQQWYMSYRFVDSFRAGSGWNAVPSWSCSKAASRQSTELAWQIPITVYTVLRLLMMDSSSSETCRILYQNKFEKYCISLAFIMRIYHDARSHECQVKYLSWKYDIVDKFFEIVMHGMSVQKIRPWLRCYPFLQMQWAWKTVIFRHVIFITIIKLQSCRHVTSPLDYLCSFFPIPRIFPSFLLLGIYLNILRNDGSPLKHISQILLLLWQSSFTSKLLLLS